MKNKAGLYLLILPQIILSIIFIIGLVYGIILSFGIIPNLGTIKPGLYYYIEIFAKEDFLSSIGFSLYLAFISALLSSVIGVIIAYFIIDLDAKALIGFIEVPIIVPHIVVALFTINIFSQNGILARIFYQLGFISTQQDFWLIVYNESGFGIILAYLWKEIPFIIYFVISIISSINKSLGEAAINLGASKLQTFFNIILPLSMNTIVSGFLIIFVFALGAYELPLLLGSTLPQAIPIKAYNEYMHPDLAHRPYSMALNTLVIIISLVSAFIYFSILNKSMKKMLKR